MLTSLGIASLAIIAAATLRCTIALIILYPQASVLQLTSSLSVPLVELPATRSLFFDWGFQMNYNFPAQLASFYNAPIWPWQRRRRRRRHQLCPAANETNTECRHRNDFTAGELYEGLQRVLVHHGYDASCLLRSVCELAQQPLLADEANLLSIVLHFLLSPMLHNGFAESEGAAKAAFELAERRGHSETDCRCWYANCTRNPLDLISRVL